MNFKELVEYAKENPVIGYIDNDCVSFYPNDDNDNDEDEDRDELLSLSPSELISEVLSLLNIESTPV